MKVLGLDIATHTGFALVENGEILTYGLIDVSRCADFRSKLVKFRADILNLISAHSPQCAAIEETYVGVNVKTTAFLNMMRGVCIESLPESVNLSSATVGTIRKSVFGKNCKKEEVFEKICSHFQLKMNPKKDMDITDAILLALWGEHKTIN